MGNRKDTEKGYQEASKKLEKKQNAAIGWLS